MRLFAPFQPQLRHAPVTAAGPAQACTIRMTIDAGSATTLHVMAATLAGACDPEAAAEPHALCREIYVH